MGHAVNINKERGVRISDASIELPQTYALPHGRCYRQYKTTTQSITIIVQVYGFSIKYNVVCLETVIFFAIY